MKCMQCGAEFDDETQYCPECGASANLSVEKPSVEPSDVLEENQTEQPDTQSSSFKTTMDTMKSRSKRRIPLVVLVAIIAALAAGSAFGIAYVYTNYIAPYIASQENMQQDENSEISDDETEDQPDVSDEGVPNEETAEEPPFEEELAESSNMAGEQENDVVEAGAPDRAPVEPESESEPGWSYANEVEYYPDEVAEQSYPDNPGTYISDDYILSDSSTRVYSQEELEALDDYDLYLAYNEIFARHGYVFDDETLQDYFDSKDWYEAILLPEEPEVLNETEGQNTDLIMSIEEERNSPYLQ